MIEYIVTTNKNSWGRGLSIKEALDNAAQYKDSGKCLIRLYTIHDLLWDDWELSHLNGQVTLYPTTQMQAISDEMRQAVFETSTSAWTAYGHKLVEREEG